VDAAAVRTGIHHPTDSGLIGDGVRVGSRLLKRARAVLGEAATGPGGAFGGRARTARGLSQPPHRIAAARASRAARRSRRPAPS